MTHVIGSPCIGTKDTACVDVCPVDCIHPRKDEDNFEQEEMLYIDPETCIDCGLCVDECPVSAIWTEEELPAEEQKYLQINADWYTNQ
jgi:NAD-dependent dihydropyrimidine dehydrogenase PreA subunit